MYYVFGFLAVVCVLLAFSRPARRMASNLWQSVNAGINKGSEKIAGTNVLAKYDAEIENFVAQGRTAQETVRAARGEIERLNDQIATDEREQTRLSNLIQAALNNGDPNNTASTYAEELVSVETSLAGNRTQLTNSMDIYKKNLALIENYERQIKEARDNARTLGMKLKQSEAERELVSAMGNLRSGLSDNRMKEAERRVLENINQNRGATAADQDMNRVAFAKLADEELVRKQNAQKVLDRFKQPATQN